MNLENINLKTMSKEELYKCLYDLNKKCKKRENGYGYSKVYEFFYTMEDENCDNPGFVKTDKGTHQGIMICQYHKGIYSRI